MTKKVRVKVSNAHKKSFIETCTWSCRLSDIKEQLDIQKKLEDSKKEEVFKAIQSI